MTETTRTKGALSLFECVSIPIGVTYVQYSTSVYLNITLQVPEGFNRISFNPIVIQPLMGSD